MPVEMMRRFAHGHAKSTLMPNGDGSLATASKTGNEVILRDSSKMKRAALAEEFGLASFHFVPTQNGLLEYGIPKTAFCPAMSLVHPLRCVATHLVQVMLCTGKKPKAIWLLRVSIQLLPAKRRLQIWASLAALAMHRKSMCSMPTVKGQLEQ